MINRRGVQSREGPYTGGKPGNINGGHICSRARCSRCRYSVTGACRRASCSCSCELNKRRQTLVSLLHKQYPVTLALLSIYLWHDRTPRGALCPLLYAVDCTPASTPVDKRIPFRHCLGPFSHVYRRQSQVDAAVSETRKIVSTSEAIARRLRSEMDVRGGELCDRRRVAMEGLAVRRPGDVEGAGSYRSNFSLLFLLGASEALSSISIALFVLLGMKC